MATLLSNLLNLKSFQRKIILFILDNFLCLAAFFIAFYLRVDLFLINERTTQIISFLILYSSFIILSFSFSFYQPLSRYYDLQNIFKIILVFILYTIIATTIFDHFKFHGLPRSIGILYPLIFLFFFISSRSLIVFILNNFRKIKKQKNAIVICHFKNAEFLRNSLRSHNILFFIVNEDEYDTRMIGNISIKSLSKLETSDFKNKIDTIFIEQSLHNEKIRKKLQKKLISKKNLPIKIIPKPENFLDFQFKEDIKNIRMFKKKIDYSIKKLKKRIFNSVIMITGSGGSIGSELVKEIIKLNPRKVILIDNSEYNLYKISKDVLSSSKTYFHLTDFNNKSEMRKILSSNKIDIIFHSAAYKHVPLIEKNPFSAIKNNFLDTYELMNLVNKFKVQNFCLISSDKAVRPTNIMGASKRLSELAICYFNNYGNKFTNFCSVRFGNVINSSGSVKPLFQNQIDNNLPITLTHRKIIRYFMTIEEAANLVLNTTRISKGGEIFLLDMGEPIKLYDLAKLMVQFSGKTIKKDGAGDIEIKIIGLREGEKLYEELLVDKESLQSSIKSIYQSLETNIDNKQFKNLYKQISNSYNENNIQDLKKILRNKFINYLPKNEK